MLIDTHCHINDAQFDTDRQQVIERAQENGIQMLIEIAESPETWEAAITLAEQYPFVYATLGIHPHHAHLYPWNTIKEKFISLSRHPKVVAIGEFGLDYFRMRNTKEEQFLLCQEQLALAHEIQKPIVIHCREAHEDLQKLLSPLFPRLSSLPSAHVSQPVGVIHCFSGTLEDAHFYIDRGFVLGVDGPLTYPSAKGLQQVMEQLPLSSIILETDSPYLPPQTHRGQRNEPLQIRTIAQALAHLQKKTLEEVALLTTHNAMALYRLHASNCSDSRNG